MPSTYDKQPFIPVPGSTSACVTGWGAINERLREEIARRASRKLVIAIDCYPGVDTALIEKELVAKLDPSLLIRSDDALLSPKAIENLATPFLGGEDPTFGWLTNLTLPQFFDPFIAMRLRAEIRRLSQGRVIVIGCGASHIAEWDLLIYADLARWEAQNRFRRGEASNLGTSNRGQPPGLQYKRAFFIDWRVADRWKRPLIARWDFVLDTNNPAEPKLADGQSVRDALDVAASRPFRVVPFFDPAPWGGQWLKQTCDLDPNTSNFGWCFDCVPEENSLLLGFGDQRLEIPALDLVFDQPHALLGEAVHARFGDEFPIRFDLLDTMGGGNLSFQVHPLTEYIQNHFGMHYTQDESYYLLDAGAGALVYLGLKDRVDRAAMIRDLERAQEESAPFEVDRYANRWPVKQHDHLLIPAGTVHCSGANCVVLEISATPYIFTFKLWDWGRPGLDGKPRPIHLEHGRKVIQWDRGTRWTQDHLINRVRSLGGGPGWREEATGLHEREFIETRRHWFTGVVHHDTEGTVNVLNLVEGEGAVIESPDRAFDPFTLNYAETVIVPAAVGPYTIRPMHKSDRPSATIKAFVR